MIDDAARFARHLTDRLGPASAPPPELLSLAESALGGDGFATVLAPDSPDGIAAALAECSSEGWPVRPIGAATWLAPLPHSAKHPARPPVLISTARLDRITEHEPADLVVGVQAGLPLHNLRHALAAQRQWLPLDPPAAPTATIGAIAANGDAGPLRAGHGTPRDLALGIEIATGDGRLIRFGGRVVKNVAGYDGVRLAIGSRGTIGVITGLYLRVGGAPRADSTLALDCGAGPDGARRGADLAIAVRDAVACDSLELLDPASAAAVARTAGAGAGPSTPLHRHPASTPGRWVLLVRMAGGEAGVEEGAARVRQLSQRAGADTTEAGTGVWSALAALESVATAALRVTGPATELAQVLDSIAGGAGGPDGWYCAAHAADGVIRLWRSGGPVPPADQERLAERVAGASGHSWTMRYDRPMTGMRPAGPAEQDGVRILAQRIRAAFDPAGVLRCGMEG